MAIKSLIKINLNDGQDVFLICNYEPAQKLNVVLLDLNECKAFSGYATDIDLRSQAATIHMTFGDFVSLTTKALTQNEPGGDQFLYYLEKNCTDILFRWKSVDQEETIINIGSVKVTESDYGSMIKNMFLMLSEEMLTLNRKVLSMETDFSNVKTEKEYALHLLSDVTDMKERVEKELYSKFMLVLNEKKRKIRELKFNTHDKLLNNANFNRKNKKSKVIHHISESSDEDGRNLESVDVAGPSTSKCNNSLLFFDDDEPELVATSPSKRRNRDKIAAPKTLNLQEPTPSVFHPSIRPMLNESLNELLDEL